MGGRAAGEGMAGRPEGRFSRGGEAAGTSFKAAEKIFQSLQKSVKKNTCKNFYGGY